MPVFVVDMQKKIPIERNLSLKLSIHTCYPNIKCLERIFILISGKTGGVVSTVLSAVHQPTVVGAVI